jgi:hypothetical protein
MPRQFMGKFSAYTHRSPHRIKLASEQPDVWE